MAGLAARVAAWQRRMGGTPGPFGGSGEASDGSPVKVELFLNGAWVDITSLVMTRSGSEKIHITRGQGDEAGQTERSVCRFQLNNRNGYFSPRNPTSPYYGQLGRNTPLRVHVPNPSDGGKLYRFWGEISNWPTKWDISGSDIWVEVDAAGILRRLAQGAAPTHSVLYTAITDPGFESLLAYWPCEDISGSISIASALTNGSTMTISGYPNLAYYNDFGSSELLPDMTDATFSGGVQGYLTTTPAQTRFLLSIPPDGVTDGKVICALIMKSSSVTTWELVYNTGGTLTLRVLDSAGVTVSGGVSAFGDVRGKRLRVSIELQQNGGNIDCAVRYLEVTSTTATSATGTVAGKTMARITDIKMAPAPVSGGVSRGLDFSTLGHVTLQNAITSMTDLGERLDPSGETAGARIQRICAEEGIPFDGVGDLSDTVRMGSQAKKKPVDLISEATEADLGVLSENLTVFGLGYRVRTNLYNQDPALTLSYSANQLAENLTPVDDDQFTRNDITVTRQDGDTAHQALTTGAMGTADPPTGIGIYGESVTLNVESDSTLADQASWRLHMGTVDEARYPQVSVNLAHPTFTANQALKTAVLRLRQGDRVVITNPPAWLPPDDISLIVLGLAETIDHFEHRITLNCAPASPYEVGVLDSGDHGRLDTAGAELAAAVDSSSTSISVSTTSGPAWTTDTADMPFDVRAGGEVMRVTAVSGSSSPQTFTVTRSVNGIVKSHSAGTDLSLANPTVIAL
ncbi:hypothetical protein IPZ58_07465 [Streptomyces roseoverticillatus]|uniref:hypothetical protein n=1 Tax=Streptomyces roseoverticillatus TaxID=66429 RepID=UPI001F37F37F|nr:hypothetical protein [Streptomyces roseoverticillatus]MCF3101417.1 hypothetical protein [Streptomyces roseoverticillatus]